MEEYALNELTGLIDRLREIKSEWIGKPYKDSPNDDWMIGYAKDDMADTDIHLCGLWEKDVSVSRYNVIVNPENDIIVDVDLNDVDIIYDGVIYDGIDLDSSDDLKNKIYKI